MLEMSVSGWEAGEACVKHDQPWCAECKAQAGMVRDDEGTLRYDGDCAVMTYCEITGEEYEAAVATMRGQGYRPGTGTEAVGLFRALRDAGYVQTQVAWGQAFARERSFLHPEAFVVIGTGYVGRKRLGHAWSITNGVVNRSLGCTPTAVFKVTSA